MKFSHSNQPNRRRRVAHHTPYESMRYAAETNNPALYNMACARASRYDLQISGDGDCRMLEIAQYKRTQKD